MQIYGLGLAKPKSGFSKYKEIRVIFPCNVLPFCLGQEPVMRQKYELVSHDQPYFRGLLHNKVRNPTLPVAHRTVHCLDDKDAYALLSMAMFTLRASSSDLK